jgi:hypothetical protein
VCCLVNNHAGKRRKSNDKSWDEEHSRPIWFPFLPGNGGRIPAC